MTHLLIKDVDLPAKAAHVLSLYPWWHPVSCRVWACWRRPGSLWIDRGASDGRIDQAWPNIFGGGWWQVFSMCGGVRRTPTIDPYLILMLDTISMYSFAEKMFRFRFDPPWKKEIYPYAHILPVSGENRILLCFIFGTWCVYSDLDVVQNFLRFSKFYCIYLKIQRSNVTITSELQSQIDDRSTLVHNQTFI